MLIPGIDRRGSRGYVVAPVSFGTWLAQQLKRNEWTQADLARKSHLSQGRISDWLNNKRRPSPASCDKLADALNVAVDDVLTMAGHRPKSDGDDDPQAAAMIALIRKTRWTEERAEPVRAMLASMAAMYGKNQRTK